MTQYADVDLQQCTGDFLRQPSGSYKNNILVEQGSDNSSLNVSDDDYTVAADRQPSMYSKVANWAAPRVKKSVWFTNSLLNVW